MTYVYIKPEIENMIQQKSLQLQMEIALDDYLKITI